MTTKLEAGHPEFDTELKLSENPSPISRNDLLMLNSRMQAKELAQELNFNSSTKNNNPNFNHNSLPAEKLGQFPGNINREVNSFNKTSNNKSSAKQR